MAFALAPDAAAAGYRLRRFDVLPSTSGAAMQAARAGEAGPAWFVAALQTEGRGRRGNAWLGGPGNLAATLLLTTALPPATIAQLGFVAGLALARALDAVSSGSPDGSPAPPRRAGTDRATGPAFALKWPNDVVAGGAKLAGILLGTEEVESGRAVTIGIGVNVAAAPDGLAHAATSLAALGCPASAADLFAALSGAWVEAAGTWDEGRGFDAIRKAWLARAAGLGGEVAVATGAGVARGRFETIDGHGQLIIRGRDGSARPVSAGEVHFGPAATLHADASS